MAKPGYERRATIFGPGISGSKIRIIIPITNQKTGRLQLLFFRIPVLPWVHQNYYPIISGSNGANSFNDGRIYKQRFAKALSSCNDNAGQCSNAFITGLLNWLKHRENCF